MSEQDTLVARKAFNWSPAGIRLHDVIFLSIIHLVTPHRAPCPYSIFTSFFVPDTHNK